ncbi:MAG: efflux RND transporter periplasmic adaptor subunit, partial [Chitinophagaceae bacterium]
DKDIVSKNELAMAEAKLAQAKATVALARTHLSFTEIRAPFDGTIDRIPKKVGSVIDDGDLLTSLSDNSQMFAYFNVSEPEYLDYKANERDKGITKVNLMLANNTLLPRQGIVETIESEFNSETGNIAFRAKFPNPDKLLRHGETGKVQMTVPMHSALIIPQKATYEIQGKTYVFLIGKDNSVHSKQITLVNEMPDLYVISGLEETDKVLLDGVQKVKENDKIIPEFVAPKELLSKLKLYAE